MADYTVPLVINGEERHTAHTYDVINPSTGELCHRSIAATPEDAVAAVEGSAAALVEWRDSVPATRRDVLLRAAEIMERRRQELAEYMIVETGSSKVWWEFNVRNGIDLLKDVAGRVSSIVGTVPTLSDPGSTGMILKEPYGVVLSVVPWNSPYILGLRATILPIAAGNTVVLKGSELSPRCLWALVSILEEAGLPKGVLNFLSTDPSRANPVTAAIINHPQVKKINFTGSLTVGRIIAKLAAEHLKPVLLELGGQAPAIVWEDADLDLAAQCCISGAFMYAGQCCMATERIIVHRNVRQEFEKKLIAAIPTLFVDIDEATLMINPSGREKVKSLVNSAEAQGAKVTRVPVNDTDTQGQGWRLQPSVLSNVTPEMEIHKNENFGPTAILHEVSSEEEALELANSTEYGLASAVFTEDLRRGLRFARRIEAGGVYINNMSVHDESALPHGGCKKSGYGRFNAEAGLSEWYRTKNVTWRN